MKVEMLRWNDPQAGMASLMAVLTCEVGSAHPLSMTHQGSRSDMLSEAKHLRVNQTKSLRRDASEASRARLLCHAERVNQTKSLRRDASEASIRQAQSLS